MIKMLEIKPVSSGNLKAFVKLKIDDIVICGFRIVRQSGQKPWVSVPQTAWTGSDGKIHYKNLIELPGILKDEIFKAVLAAWKN